VSRLMILEVGAETARKGIFMRMARQTA
jgi:hypothetical protein